jgi:hypothetical protein
MSDLSEVENDRLANGWFMHQECGYIAIQSTQPQTLALGKASSGVPKASL